MPPLLRPLQVIAMTIMLAIAGCKTTQDKVDAAIEAGRVQFAAGDAKGAIAALQRAVETDPTYAPARQALGEALLAQGAFDPAKRQFRAWLEQVPDALPAHQALAEIGLATHDDTLLSLHGGSAMRIDSADPRSTGISIAMAYRAAAAARNAADKARAVTAARALLAMDASNLAARRVVILDLMEGPDPTLALPEIETATSRAPGWLDLQMLKLKVLSGSGDAQAAGDQLKAMFARFPGNPDIRTRLRAWYEARGNVTEIAAFLREVAAQDGNLPAGRIAVVTYLREKQGDEAALAELDRLVADAKDAAEADTFRGVAAGFAIDAGQADKAIAVLKDILGRAKPSEETEDLKMKLATALAATGDITAARHLVEEVLVANAFRIDAVKLGAAWHLADGEGEAALNLLRPAVSARPKDPELLTMIAEAYEMQDMTSLVGSSLAQAVAASNQGVRESLKFHDFLMRQGQSKAAESVLGAALLEHPGDLSLLTSKAVQDIGQLNWKGLTDTIVVMEANSAPEAVRTAAALRSERDLRREAQTALVATLDRVSGKGNPDLFGGALRLKRMLERGGIDTALPIVAEMQRVAPNDPEIPVIRAQLAVLLAPVMPGTDRADP